MAIIETRVQNYRSVRDFSICLERVNILIGPNGCGKTNLYRSLFLLSEAAAGRLALAIASEGGMGSALWAGPRGRNEKREFTIEITVGDVLYLLRLGLPLPQTAFSMDPVIKEEHIWFVQGRKRIPLLERNSGTAWARDADGRRITYPLTLDESESVLAQLREPHRFPQLSLLRQELLSWRFYHQFRTDTDSPIRSAQIGVRTPALAHDGHDLAAALRTIIENGDDEALRKAVAQAFPGSALLIGGGQGQFEVLIQMPGIDRPFDARELSDGTLRYLCLLAALHSPRPPSLLALNEPETSIHPDLIDSLGDMIVHAARESQLWVTTHSEKLAIRIHDATGITPVRLDKIDGETRRSGWGKYQFEES